MYRNPKSFYIVRPVGSPGKIGQVELNLIPSLIQPHRHSANEWFDSGGRLIIRCSESPPDILIIEDLHFEGKIFFKLSYDDGTFLMIMTRKGSLIPSVYDSLAGQVIYAVVTLVPMISSTED